MSSLSLDQVANYKPLARCGIEELAMYQISAKPSGGIMFARKQEHEQKDAARAEIVRLFAPNGRFAKKLHILTMPGVDWKFERKLLAKREGNWWMRAEPQRTRFACIENDRAIYHAAVTRLPGLNTPQCRTEVLPGTTFAERCVRTRWVRRFYFGNVDDLMRDPSQQFDAAWLDYTGPLTTERLALIKRFYKDNVRAALIVTALRARWNRQTSDAIDRAGGHSTWFTKAIPGAVLHDIEYQDGASPMAQIAVHKGLA